MREAFAVRWTHGRGVSQNFKWQIDWRILQAQLGKASLSFFFCSGQHIAQ